MRSLLALLRRFPVLNTRDGDNSCTDTQLAPQRHPRVASTQPVSQICIVCATVMRRRLLELNMLNNSNNHRRTGCSDVCADDPPVYSPLKMTLWATSALLFSFDFLNCTLLWSWRMPEITPWRLTPWRKKTQTVTPRRWTPPPVDVHTPEKTHLSVLVKWLARKTLKNLSVYTLQYCFVVFLLRL